MRSNGDSLNIKVVPLDDTKLSHAENPFTLYIAKISCQQVRHSYLWKIATIDPLYLWVINVLKGLSIPFG